jgi:exopolysaccharide biosynthesis WecB/TagA/CpsF family protein
MNSVKVAEFGVLPHLSGVCVSIIAILNGVKAQRGLAVLQVGHVRIASLSQTEAVARLETHLAKDEHLRLAFANSHVVNVADSDPVYRAALDEFLVLPDGIGVDLGARIIHGVPFRDNLNGTDFIPALLSAIPSSLKVGLYGARPGVADRACLAFARQAPHHSYHVFGHGFQGTAEEAAMLDRLEAEKPDLLLVAFGNPRQEMWIASRVDARHCTVAAGVGALFDFMAGEVPRAPLWLRQLKLEWLFRLINEPRRLWRRYILGNPRFMVRVIRQRMTGRP